MFAYYIILITIFIKFNVISLKLLLSIKSKCIPVKADDLINLYRIITIVSHISSSFILHL